MTRFIDENGTTHTMTKVNDGTSNWLKALGTIGFGLGVTNAVGITGNNNGCNNGGILGNLFNGGSNECYETISGSNLKLQLANVDARNYADGVGLALYKELNKADIDTYFVLDAKLEKERDARIVSEKEQQAFNVDMLLRFGEQDKQIALNKQAGEYQYALTHKDINSVATKAAYDNNTVMCYVDANFVKGELVLNADKICPPVKLENDSILRRLGLALTDVVKQ